MSDFDLNHAFDKEPGPDPALIERISGRVATGLTPVRPLPPRWVLAAGMIVLVLAVALAGAAYFGIYGIQELTAGQAAAIFTVLAILLGAAAMASVAGMIPGSRRVLRGWPLAASACVALAATFAAVFRDYSMDDFVPEGMVCFEAGLLVAIPAAALVWLVLRRGFTLDRPQSGASAGALGGLAGVLMLELHCPNLALPHVAVWHVAVIPASALAGWLVGAIVPRRNGESGARRGENL